MKKRLDILMVEKELAPSREKAQAIILAGQVLINEICVDKPGKQIPHTAIIRVKGKDHPFVSRGGVKLESALNDFGFSPEGMEAMDIGASTGGFTHCLLLHGASHVFAVDVGYGQLAWELKNDPRVTSLERTNIRHLEFDKVGRLVDLVVIDASFISLRLIFPHVHRFLKTGGFVIALVKPQFEAGKESVSKGGIVKKEGIHQKVLDELTEEAKIQDFQVLKCTESAIIGKKSGNKEFFLFLQKQT